MKLYKLMLLSFLLLGVSCKNDKNKSEETEPVAQAETEALPEMSVFQLPSSWTTQEGEDIQLEELRGEVLVMVMIYTSCQAACPRLVADMRNIQKKVSEEANEKTKYVFVSIDPEVDTPKRLKTFAKENKMNNDQWLFLRGNKDATREFAAVLAVNYKRISPMDFSHSNIISVFDKDGVLVHQKEGLGTDDSKTIEAIEEHAID
ncbi:SCO family protein [Salegentibacter sediminis]|uniref:SCO family protein n=1 Tax=Salegentibacter sediminis TaxID=1930251 RepID=UPI0009BDEFC3|nr:SCO family protein [Salegentibacter sediminis]